jgi:hypothetical protein
MANQTERRGFAIPTAILVIMVMTIMVAGGFSLVSAERRSVADQRSQISAFQIAERGLELFLIRRDSLLPDAPRVPGAKDSVRIYFSAGYADVSLTRIRPVMGTMSGLYVVRSKGVETVGAYAGSPEGVRTVAQYVLWEPAPMQVLAGWTALSGLDKNGNAGTLGGFDACGEADAVAGVVVPVNPGYTGKNTAAEGDPAIDTVEADSVAIDWDAIINHDAIKPTITIPGGSWPTPTMWADTTFYPIIMVKQADFDLPGTGLPSTHPGYQPRGMLIVSGHLTLNGSVGWDGVLLVGGDIVSNGNNGVAGATISGLNVKLGTYEPASTANGTKTYIYDSCEVSRATTAAGALVTLKNTWVDNWVEY